jgi:hypothetical protein
MVNLDLVVIFPSTIVQLLEHYILDEVAVGLELLSLVL